MVAVAVAVVEQMIVLPVLNMKCEQVLHNQPDELGGVVNSSFSSDNDENQCQPTDDGDCGHQRTAAAATSSIGQTSPAQAIVSTGATMTRSALAATTVTYDDDLAAFTSLAARLSDVRHASGAADLVVANEPVVAVAGSERSQQQQQQQQQSTGESDHKTTSQRPHLACSHRGRHLVSVKQCTQQALGGCSLSRQSARPFGLLTLSLIMIVVGHQSSALVVSGARLATIYDDQQRTYLDSGCASRLVGLASEAAHILLMLKCDLKPLYEQYVAAYGPDAAKTIGGREEIGRDLAEVSQKIDEFAEKGFTMLSLTDLCTFHTVQRLSSLRDLAFGSRLLTLAYDAISIEFHASCLGGVIEKLPQVPRLVREIVLLYIEGADQKLIRPSADANRGSIDFDEQPFDVDAAIARNGHLEQIVGLLLSFGEVKSDKEIVEDFKKQCKSFFIEIEQRWDTGEMMSSMLTTEGNAIKPVNNYIMRTLAQTKFADICSQLSSRA